MTITKEFVAPLLRPKTFKRNIKWWQRIWKWRTTRRNWRLQEDWIYWDDTLKLFIKIPDRFTFDGASVPKFFQSIVSAIDGLFYGSIPHDFIYRFDQLIVCPEDEDGNCSEIWYLKDDIGKLAADKMLLYLPKQIENRLIPNSIAYGIINIFGIFSWENHRKDGYKLISPYPSRANRYLLKSGE